MPHECGNRATNAQASEALNVRSDAREDSQSRGASGQDPRESEQKTSRADTGEAECTARVGQGRVAEQHVENKQRSAHSPENGTDPQGQSRTKERGRERTQQTPEISLTSPAKKKPSTNGEAHKAAAGRHASRKRAEHRREHVRSPST